jgi:plasmid maintenance system antidote protein VapI
MKKKKLHPVHPGEILLEEFLKPMGLSQNKLALNIGVPPRRINEIILEKRKITLIQLQGLRAFEHPRVLAWPRLNMTGCCR